MLQGWEVNGCR